MTKILSCINLKGGVGKTALATNFAAFCGSLGKRTLLIDLDPQTNATFATIGVQRWRDAADNSGTVADLLGARRHARADDNERSAEDIILPSIFPGVDLIPSHIDLFSIDLDMAGVSFREVKLKNSLREIIDNYDVVVCDCPPNLTIPTQNALALSSHYVIPVSLDFLSAVGIGLLLTRVEEFSRDLDHALDNCGIVISRVGRPAIHREETEATIRDQFGDLVLNPMIHERVAVSRAAQNAQPVFNANDDAAADFRAVSMELLRRLDA